MVSRGAFRPGAARNRSGPKLDVGPSPQSLAAPIANRRWKHDALGKLVGPLGRNVEDLGDVGEVNQLLHGASYPARTKRATREVTQLLATLTVRRKCTIERARWISREQKCRLLRLPVL